MVKNRGGSWGLVAERRGGGKGRDGKKGKGPHKKIFKNL